MAKPNRAAGAKEGTQAQQGAASKRVMLETHDLSDLRLPSLDGEGFPEGRHPITLGVLQRERHEGAYYVLDFLEAIGVSDPNTVLGYIKADANGTTGRLYAFEVVRSKDGSQILLKAGDALIPLQQKEDKLIEARLQNGAISFQTRERQDKTTYQLAKVTFTTKVNPANYVVPISLDSDLRDEEGALLDAAAVLQSDFAQGSYETLLELLAPPKDPVVMMHEMSTGVYKVLLVGEPVPKSGTKDGKPWGFNSYLIKLEMPDGSHVVTYSDGSIRDDLDAKHKAKKAKAARGQGTYDPIDVLDLGHNSYWVHIRAIEVKNLKEVEKGEDPKYKVIACLADQYPLHFNADADADE